MIRIFATAAFAAVFGLVLVAMAAQRSAATETPPQIGNAAAANVIEPGEIRASKLLGSAVHNARDTKIGTVKELIIEKDGRVAAVIVKVAFVGFGDKYVAVNLEDLTSRDNRLTLDRTSDQLQQMTGYNLDENVSGIAGSSLNSGSRPIPVQPR